MHIVIDLQATHLFEALERARVSVAEPEELLASFGESLQRRNSERHAQGLDPDGNQWTPLSPLTLGNAVARAKGGRLKNGSMSLAVARKAIERKTRKGILRESGDMLNDLHYQVDSSELRLGFDDPKAAWHHHGTGTHGPKGAPYEIRPRVAKALAFAGLVVKRVNHPGLPARKLLGFPAEDRQLVEELAADHLMAVLKGVR